MPRPRAPRSSLGSAPGSRVALAGIDENGLGPRLGPLVVTGAWARATEKGASVVAGAPAPSKRGSVGARDGDAEQPVRWPGAARLGDSKKLVAFGDSALGEAWARAIAARQGATPSSPEEVLRALSIDSDAVLRMRCPGDHVRQCWGAAAERFEASEELVTTIAADLAALDRVGVDVRGVRVAVVCSERLNDAAARGLSRFDVDLHAMERVALALRGDAECDLDATCGKVGGLNAYGPRFGPLAGRARTALVEGRAESAYRIDGLGRIAFVRDADDAQLLVCLASLVGKWVRDLLMNRIVRYHREHDGELPAASGYHDPVTTRFIAASALARRARALPDPCFERKRVDELANASELPTTLPLFG